MPASACLPAGALPLRATDRPRAAAQQQPVRGSAWRTGPNGVCSARRRIRARFHRDRRDRCRRSCRCRPCCRYCRSCRCRPCCRYCRCCRSRSTPTRSYCSPHHRRARRRRRPTRPEWSSWSKWESSWSSGVTSWWWWSSGVTWSRSLPGQRSPFRPRSGWRWALTLHPVVPTCWRPRRHRQPTASFRLAPDPCRWTSHRVQPSADLRNPWGRRSLLRERWSPCPRSAGRQDPVQRRSAGRPGRHPCSHRP